MKTEGRKAMRAEERGLGTGKERKGEEKEGGGVLFGIRARTCFPLFPLEDCTIKREVLVVVFTVFDVARTVVPSRCVHS